MGVRHAHPPLTSTPTNNSRQSNIKLPPKIGSKLDILARLPLWSWGLDYKHGTGAWVSLQRVPWEGSL